MLTVGLTGCVACGKTTVLRILGRLGARTLSSDAIVHGLVRRGTAEYRKIVRRFGARILNLQGELDRKKLRRLVSHHPARLRFLERVLHPAVRKKIRLELKASRRKKGIFVIEVPLLFETGMEKGFDRSLAVIAPNKNQKRWARRKGMGPGDLQAFNQRQWSSEEKALRADRVIWNTGDLRELKTQAARVYASYRDDEKKF